MKRLLLVLAALSSHHAYAQQPFTTLVGDFSVEKVGDRPSEKVGLVSTQVPFITWGGDVATFLANGGLNTTADSVYGKSGLNLKLVAGDDFVQQVRDYLAGKSPYLRCTTDMLGMASEVVNKDPRTKPVVVFQLTWSAGDHIVSRENIRTLNDLKGKTVCLQTGGPHTGLLYDSLRAAGLDIKDVKIVWAKDLTGSPDSPAEMFRKDPKIDACCVISPDMIGLCSGLTSIGSGAEGTVKGSHVVNSTASMSRSIADIYVVRSDYYKAHKDLVEKFVVGYLKGAEELLEVKKQYDDGKGNSPKYLAALKMAQDIYGAKTLPTIENDAHGLVSDANFVRIPGNEIFFNDPNNLTGFAVKQTNALDLAMKLGSIKEKLGFDKSDWDYKKLSEAVGVKYVAPVYATGRVKAEVADFGKDLDTNTILTFEIKFEPEQITFPVETYAADFKRFCQLSATFSNAVVVIEGHSDPTLALQHFFWAAKAKGLITGSDGVYKFKEQPLDLKDTELVIKTIQSENFAGQKRTNSEGQEVEIPDPKQTVVAALTLSKSRAEAVRKSIENYAKANSFQVDLSQIKPWGVGVASPVNPRPRNMQQAKENMRVVFRVVRVKAEALKSEDFDFDK